MHARAADPFPAAKPESVGLARKDLDAIADLVNGFVKADAVIGVQRLKCAEMGPGARTVSGVAVRVEDAADRPRLRLRWFAEEVAALTNRMLLLLLTVYEFSR